MINDINQEHPNDSSKYEESIFFGIATEMILVALISSLTITVICYVYMKEYTLKKSSLELLQAAQNFHSFQTNFKANTNISNNMKITYYKDMVSKPLVTNSYNFIINKFGEIIIHTDEVVLKVLNGETKKTNSTTIPSEKVKIASIISKRIQNNKNKENLLLIPINIDNTLATIIPLTDENFYFVSIIPESIVSKNAFESSIFVVWFGGLFSLAQTIVLFFIVRHRISRPLSNLVSGIKKISNGDFILNLSPVYKDELGLVTKNLNDMAFNLHRKNREAEEYQNQLIEQTQKAEIASQTKSRFLANMSHEIRTPLNGIIGVSRIVHETELNDQQKNLVSTISLSATSLLSIINDILDLSKIEANRLEIENTEFDFEELINNINNIIQVEVQKKEINYKTNLNLNLKNYLLGDENRLRQVLLNILSNAIKFTPQYGFVSLDIKLQKSNESNDVIRIEVSDSGIGISEENQKKLFQPFTQADISTTKKYGGTGLGLSISKSLIKLMGGEIGLKSTIGQGSIFWIELPLNMSQELITQNKNLDLINPSNQAFNLERKRILVVDDNPVNLMIAKQILEKASGSVQCADNGEMALKSLNENQYDLILMDCQMPIMDGYQATQLIRKNPLQNISNIPIIALTANAMSGDREYCIKSGMDGFVSKPFQVQELFSEISRVLYLNRL